MDLSSTEWLEAGIAELRTAGPRLVVDTLEVGVPGVVLTAAGALDDGLRAALSVAIHDSSFVREIAPGPTDSLTATVDLRAELSEVLTAPMGEIRLEADALGPEWAFPAVRARADLTPTELAIEVTSGEGTRVGPVLLDTLDVRSRGRGRDDGFLPADVAVALSGRDLALNQHVTIDRTTAWSAILNSLDLRLGSETLTAPHAATFTFDPVAEEIAIRDFDLSGTIGSAHVAGTAGPRDTNLDAALRVTLPDSPPLSLEIPLAVWPQTVELDASARGTASLDVEARVTRLEVGAEDDVDLALRIRGETNGLTAAITLGDSTDARLRASAVYPGSLRLFPPALMTDPGELHGSLSFDGFRWPIDLRAPDSRTFRVDGELTADGTMTDPRLSADVAVSFPSWSRLRPYLVRISSAFAPGSAATVSAEVTKDEAELATARSEIPVRWLGEPPWLELPPDGHLVFRLVTEPLALADFGELLPPSTSVDGTAEVQVRADGPLRDAALEGTARVRDLRVRLADGSRVVGRGDMSVSGTLTNPTVRGDLKVTNGIVRVPEPPKNLLPRDGPAVLWESGLRADPSETASPRVAAVAPHPVMPNLDIRVEIPSALWIRGQGLDIELAGDLRLVSTEEELPNLFGELDAVGGTLTLLGRRFTVERGNVLFLGDDQLAPTLDIRLALVVDLATVYVDVSGTAQEPRLDLTSEPELSEGDIASILLFGRPINELSGNESELLEQRASEVAVALGTARLEEAIANQLGVDLIRIETGSSGGSTLVLGKYLSPRLLLQYEQALDDAGAFFVNLEYLLTRRLRVESLVGREDNSGIQLNWIREY